MLGDLQEPPHESVEAQKSAMEQLNESISELEKQGDPYIGPIQWIIEIEKEKRGKQVWKIIAIISLIHLCIVYSLGTIFLIRVIISL